MTQVDGIGRLVEVNGTQLYVDERGDPGAPVLVYLHGGPGKSCFDFLEIQGDRLAKDLRLIGVDQRGVLRSAALDPTKGLSVSLYVEDFDQLRQVLGVDRWSLLGHSAGGAIALDYVLAHPQAVEGVVFDCPAWDVDLTDRYRLPAAAALFDELGDRESASRCRELATRDERLGFDDETWRFLGRLGDRVDDLFFHDPAGAVAYGEVEKDTFSPEQWSKGVSNLPLMADMYRSRLPDLPRISRPPMLLVGVEDLVAPEPMRQAYRDGVDAGRFHEFAKAAHFSYFEQPDEYADTVVDFVLAAGAAGSE